MKTLYWHDYETWGVDPARDKPSQFAGIRTNEDLEIISEPLMIYCRPPADALPHPMACLVTKLLPQTAAEKGLSEAEFAAAIHKEFSQPGTCGVGYNSLRFDDNVSRNLFYRNFYDPYEREWQRGNSRWDILDMARLTYALRPEGIEWPLREDGTPSFRLEHLTAANGLAHESAHDALSDVIATIEFAKLIKQRQPMLYDYVYQLRKKNTVKAKLDLVQRKPFLHVSGMLPASRGCMSIMMPLAVHPVNSNEIICFDLMADPSPVLDLSADKIKEKLYTKTADLAEGEERIGLKNIRLNYCPIIAPLSMLDAKTAERLTLDRERCEQNWLRLCSADIDEKIQQVFSAGHTAERPKLDVETRLYDGFISDSDKSQAVNVRKASIEQLRDQSFPLQDSRLVELLFRYRARNFPQSLSAEESAQWQEFCFERITEPEQGYLGIEQFHSEIERLLASAEYSEADKNLLLQLSDYGDDLLAGH